MSFRQLSRVTLTNYVAAALLAGCGMQMDPMVTSHEGTGPSTSSAESRAALEDDTGLTLGQPSASAFKVLHHFTNDAIGNEPEAPLYNYKGTLYGTTSEGFGAVFSVTKRGRLKLIHAFSNSPYDGASPVAGVIERGGIFYGTTSYGGSYCLYPYTRCGTVFSVTPNGVETILHSFGNGSDGSVPDAGLVDVKGTLYGTTSMGGMYGYGTVFSLTTSGTEKVLHSFYDDGQWPMSGLDYLNGTFYGTTYYGGAYGPGTVFSIRLSTTGAVVEKIVHSFGGPDGAYPIGGLIDVKGVLYGTTAGGGVSDGDGTVYSMTSSGAEQVLHTFTDSPDGSNPWGSLTYKKGVFYGTTVNGGAYKRKRGRSGGTVFSMTPDGTETILHSFGKVIKEGMQPRAGVIDVGGTLYGTTSSGGRRRCGGTHPDCGTVFSVQP